MVLLARLAVDISAQGKGLGPHLLVEAMRKVAGAAREFGVFALAVDAKDEHAADFYRKYGFTELRDQPLKLLMTTKTIEKVLAAT